MPPSWRTRPSMILAIVRPALSAVSSAGFALWPLSLRLASCVCAPRRVAREAAAGRPERSRPMRAAAERSASPPSPSAASSSSSASDAANSAYVGGVPASQRASSQLFESAVNLKVCINLYILSHGTHNKKQQAQRRQSAKEHTSSRSSSCSSCSAAALQRWLLSRRLSPLLLGLPC